MYPCLPAPSNELHLPLMPLRPLSSCVRLAAHDRRIPPCRACTRWRTMTAAVMTVAARATAMSTAVTRAMTRRWAQWGRTSRMRARCLFFVHPPSKSSISCPILAPPPAGGMHIPRLTAHRVPYDGRGGRRAMPLEAWQPVRTVVAGCVRVRCGAELSPQTGISCGWLLVLALLDVVESFSSVTS
jgi:hypothetical protein